jgi:hypothetical protein
LEYSEESIEMPEQIFFHYGISVPNVGVICNFFERVFGFKILQKRTISHPYIYSLIGQQDLSAEVAMIEIDSTSFLEVLAWKSEIESTDDYILKQTQLTDIGAQHICFFSNEIDILYARILLEAEVEVISNGVIEVEDGPNKGAKVFFVKLFGFLFLEIFQKPKINP